MHHDHRSRQFTDSDTHIQPLASGSPATENRMEDQQDPPANVIDEVASILATGYLRMRNARTIQEPGDGDPAECLDNSPNPSLYRCGGS